MPKIHSNTPLPAYSKVVNLLSSPGPEIRQKCQPWMTGIVGAKKCERAPMYVCKEPSGVCKLPARDDPVCPMNPASGYGYQQ